MNSAQLIALTFLLPTLVVTSGAAPKESRYCALRFDSAEAVARSLSMLDDLTGSSSAPLPPSRKETAAYRVRAKLSLLRFSMGSMTLSVEPTRFAGRDCLHIVQRAQVLGRYQNEESYVDIHGGFPYRYTVDTRRTMRKRAFSHLVMWDRLGGRVYLQKRRPNGVVRQYVWALGQDEPWDSTDPLSAMARYRRQCETALSTVPWTGNVLLGCDERYRLYATPQPPDKKLAPGLSRVRWHWEARECEEDDKTVLGQLNIHSNAIPVHYEAKAWGTKGSADLRTYRVATDGDTH